MNDHDEPVEEERMADDAVGDEDENDNEGGGGGAGDHDADPQIEFEVLKDRFLRLAADLENTRRRAAKEKADAAQYAIANFARDLVNVADNFERALQAAGVTEGEAPEGRSDAFRGLVAGIQMTEKELLSTLQRHGVQKLAPAGERFDPNHHQAVANVPSADIPKGHVVDVAQPGFTIGDRVLRAAMVTVSSGPANGGAASSGDGETGARLDEEA